MTRAEYILSIVDEGVAGKVAGGAAIGSAGYLAKKHFSSSGLAGNAAKTAKEHKEFLKKNAKGVIGKWAQGSAGKEAMKDIVDYGKRKVTGQ